MKGSVGYYTLQQPKPNVHSVLYATWFFKLAT